jgi:hypothetical protein
MVGNQQCFDRLRGAEVPGRAAIQLPEDLKDEVEAMRIRLANSTGRVPVNHEVIRAVMQVGAVHYDETLAALIRIRSAE